MCDTGCLWRRNLTLDIIHVRNLFVKHFFQIFRDFQSLCALSEINQYAIAVYITGFVRGS